MATKPQQHGFDHARCALGQLQQWLTHHRLQRGLAARWHAGSVSHQRLDGAGQLHNPELRFYTMGDDHVASEWRGHQCSGQWGDAD
jgi:hypothetical protein